MIHVALSEDEKGIISVFSCSQDTTVEVTADDPRYIDFYNSQPEIIQNSLKPPIL